MIESLVYLYAIVIWLAFHHARGCGLARIECMVVGLLFPFIFPFVMFYQVKNLGD